MESLMKIETNFRVPYTKVGDLLPKDSALWISVKYTHDITVNMVSLPESNQMSGQWTNPVFDCYVLCAVFRSYMTTGHWDKDAWWLKAKGPTEEPASMPLSPLQTLTWTQTFTWAQLHICLVLHTFLGQLTAAVGEMELRFHRHHLTHSRSPRASYQILLGLFPVVLMSLAAS